MGARLRLCFVGPHGSGKSTLGRAVAHGLDAPFRPELGAMLRRAALRRSARHHALRPDAAFDHAVLQGDLALDDEEPACAVQVIETWHPGNMAYAHLRSPGVAIRLEARVRAAAQQGPVLVQPLRISDATFAQRITEPGGPLAQRTAFFQQVGQLAVQWAQRWGLLVLPVIDTGTTSVSEATDIVIGAVQSWSIRHRMNQSSHLELQVEGQ